MGDHPVKILKAGFVGCHFDAHKKNHHGRIFSAAIELFISIKGELIFFVNPSLFSYFFYKIIAFRKMESIMAK